MSTLVIRHIPDSDPPKFQVAREDQKSSEPAPVVSPFGFPVEGRPDSGLMSEMRWYLEDFLEYPFSPSTDHADHVLDALDAWGKKAFNDLFDGGMARDFFRDATRDGYQNLRLQIMSDDARILQWPWEALLDPQAAYLSIACQIERRLNKVSDPIPISDELPRDRINILLVTARPYEQDVGYRSISRPLVELIERDNIPAHAHVLRPPTFENLRRHLKERPHFYHIIHFDGHGGYGVNSSTGSSQHKFQGVLVFEDDKGKDRLVTASQLSGLLRENAVPVMVLNACRSAMLDQGAEDPFASVAASLLKAGIRGVVAMAYNLYVSGAQEFLPDFYRELFESGDLSIATRAGRQKMEGQRKRVCARGKYDLKDFIVPVIYAQEQYNLSFGADAPESEVLQKIELPEKARDEENPYGFIGRDRELLKLERAMRKDTPAILVHGLGGVGKTTLARGFVKWLADTEGTVGCLWVGFIDVRSVEFVINSMGAALFGPNFIAADMDQKIEALAQALKENRFVIVWDNFEVVAGIPGTYISANLSSEDQQLLLRLLEKIRGGKSKIIITSRSEEDWLKIQRLKVSIGGLVGEETWEYCDKILDDLGIPVDRTDKDQVELMDLLSGHPLAMRVILPRLEKMTSRQIIEAVRSNMDALGPGAESFYATLQFAVEQLDEELRPLLIPLGFHEGFADADYLEHMAKQVDEDWKRKKIDMFFQSLAATGLLRHVGSNTYELHPALTGFLRSTLLRSIPQETHDTWTRAFVDIMGSLADQIDQRELHERRMPFHCHSANFRYALSESERLEMETDQGILIQSLAANALNTRNFSEASELFLRLANLASRIGYKEGEAGAYHQLGMVAQEQRDFRAAERWYLKSLEIEEKLGSEHGAAITYHQLGMLTLEQGDVKTAEKWYLKGVEIFEKLNIEHSAAVAYHQLGRIAEEQRDFKTAEKWYLKCVEIFERLNNEHHAAVAYHQLGIIAAEQGDFKNAEQWYLKSLTIKEKQGDEHGAATTYHQLGINAQEQRDFETAEKWYIKSLAIDEKHGDEHGAASTYHQLGMIAEDQKDFETAQKWYRKSLVVMDRLGDEHTSAITYHQLGMIAEKQRDFKNAEKWYMKSLEIEEKHGNEHGAASTYQQLGMIAEEQRDFKNAEKWYLKSLDIKEKQGDEHGAASTYGQLGALEGLQGHFDESGKWLIKGIKAFTRCKDRRLADQTRDNFMVFFKNAPSEDQAKLRAMWEEAGLGPLPEVEESEGAK